MTRRGRVPHPLSGSTLTNLLRTLVRYGSRHVKWGQVAKVTSLVAASGPFRIYERFRWGRAVRGITVREPIFVGGHWQSGQTLVQTLLGCDPRFATMQLKHAVQPAACLTMQPVLHWFLKGRLPQTRLADRLPHHLQAPQGDDLPLGLLTGLSFYNAWYFPSRAEAVFRRSVLMDDVPPAELDGWERRYVQLLKKVMLECEQQRIALRSTCITARPRHLVSVFPDARFIFCHRDPYEVFAASLERWDGLTQAFSLEREPLARSELEELTLSWYERMLGRYLAERSAIPAGRIVEVAYRDLHERPLETIQQVYAELGLEDFDAARPHMESMLKDHPWALAGEQPLTPAQRRAVRARWEFAFREWGYPL